MVGFAVMGHGVVGSGVVEVFIKTTTALFPAPEPTLTLNIFLT